jgi:hypothetical protein
MSTLAKALIATEIAGYGLSLNFGYPFDTVLGAVVTVAVIAGTWALDSLARYVRDFRRKK